MRMMTIFLLLEIIIIIIIIHKIIHTIHYAFPSLGLLCSSSSSLFSFSRDVLKYTTVFFFLSFVVPRI